MFGSTLIATNPYSVCLARGRSYTVPPTALIENCDHWHLSNVADLRDGPMNSMAVLRRDLVGLLICGHDMTFALTASGWALPKSEIEL